MAKKDNTSVKVSFKIGELIAWGGMPFSEEEIIKDWFMIFIDEVCPEKRKGFENISLSLCTATRWIEDMNQDIENQLD